MKKKIKWLFLFMAMTLIFSLSLTAYASDMVEYQQVIDKGELLSEDEEAELNTKVNEIIKNHNFDVVILTVPDMGGASAQDFADDYYDYNGYGVGDDATGVLFLISRDDRKYYTTTSGEAIKAFTDYGIGVVNENVEMYLTDDDYYNACDTFLDITNDFVAAYEEGTPYDVDNEYQTSGTILFAELIALVIALVIGLVSVLIMKAGMNTARPQTYAGDYVKQDSFKVTGKSDTYMYSRVTKIKKEEKSEGGSSTHTSSSGNTHGGGGGSF